MSNINFQAKTTALQWVEHNPFGDNDLPTVGRWILVKELNGYRAGVAYEGITRGKFTVRGRADKTLVFTQLGYGAEWAYLPQPPASEG